MAVYKRDCFAYDRDADRFNMCRILKNLSCNNCSFYKTTKEHVDSFYAAKRRIESFDERTRHRVHAKYYPEQNHIKEVG